MCYFLYGGINEGVDTKELEKAESNSGYRFSVVSEESIKRFIRIGYGGYEITPGCHCNCGTAVGSREELEKESKWGEEQEKELEELAGHIRLLRTVKNAKHIYISKSWIDDETHKECTLHIEDVDLAQFLGDIEERCLYKIQLYKRDY